MMLKFKFLNFMSNLPKLSFTVYAEEHVLRGDQTLIDSMQSSVLFLHGAGQSTRLLFDPIRCALFAHQIPSIAFDFIGHGETRGCLRSSSLLQRFKQSCQIIESLNITQPLSIIASSMSGYIAIKLLEKYQIENLILIVPAIYHAASFSVPFNQGFSDMIRQHQSWLQSDAWQLLQHYRNNLLLVSAENDEVVPLEIIQKIYYSASHAHKKWHIVSQSPHKILAFLAQHPKELQAVNNSILDVITKGK